MQLATYSIIAMTREDIPDKYCIDLARLFHLNSKRSELPVPKDEYYFNQLKKEQDPDVGELFILALKTDKEKVIGYARLEYRINEINDRTYSTLEMFVKENERRHKVGTSLFQSVLTNKPDIITTIRVDIYSESFLNQLIQTRIHLQPSYLVVRNVSNLTELERELYITDLDKREENLLKKNIRLIYRNNENYQDIEKEYSDLMKKVWNTPPDVDVTEIKEEDFPVERVRGMMKYIENSGGKYHAFFAENILTKELLGVCHIMILNENPTRAYQSFTGVLPSYRGIGIGYTIKLKTLIYLFTTEVELWTTENAEINEHMLRINKKLGFKEFKKIAVYELKEKEWKKLS